MAFSGLAYGVGKNVTYRTAECRNRLVVGDLWAFWGAEDNVAFLQQSCVHRAGGGTAARNSLRQKCFLKGALSENYLGLWFDLAIRSCWSCDIPVASAAKIFVQRERKKKKKVLLD